MKFHFRVFFLLISAILNFALFAQAAHTQSLLKSLDSKERLVRDKSAYKLAKQGTEEAKTKFTSLIQGANDSLRETAIIGLGMCEAKNSDAKKRKASLDLLCLQLKAQNWRIRQSAIIALGIMGDKRAIPAIKRLSRDSFYLKRRDCYPIREAAKSALDKIDYLSKLKDIRNLWKEGDKKIEEGNLREAFSFFRRIIAKDKKNELGFSDDAEFILGYIHGKEGRYKKAISVFNSLLDKYRDFEKKDKALYCLSLCYLNLGKYEKGRQVLVSLEQEFPYSPITKSAKKLLKKLEEL